MIGDQYEFADPNRLKLIYDSNRKLVGLQNPHGSGADLRDPFTAAQNAVLQALIDAYSAQPTVWYPGDVTSVTTPHIVADGDLSTATDQVPSLWRIVADPDDQVTAAAQLMSGTNLWASINCGAPVVQKAVLDASGARKVFTRAYAICVSSSGVPADYTGGAYIINSANTNIGDWLANMCEFQWAGGLGATDLRAVASNVFNTYYSGLAIDAGKIA